MTPEKLLDALNDIDGKAIRDARAAKAPASRFRSRRFAAILAAVIALVAMTVTAFAAEEIAGWFRDYFARNADLTQKQIEYIEENEQIVAETQKHNGYSLELKSVLSDSSTIYVTIGVTAPSDVTYADLVSLSGMGMDFYDKDGTPGGSWGLQICDDSDGLENTVDLVLELNPATWNRGSMWTLRVDELRKEVYNKEYAQELLETKYAGQSSIMFTDEEAAQIYQYVTLAEGPWEFTIDLSKVEKEELELITEPVTAQNCYGFKADGTNVYEEVEITSFILRPLSATIKADFDVSALDFTSDADHQIYVIMKDGSRIELTGNWGTIGEQHLTAESPIVLNEVDYVLMADGTKLMVP